MVLLLVVWCMRVPIPKVRLSQGEDTFHLVRLPSPCDVVTILGIEIGLNLRGAHFRPDAAKITKWSRQINGFLHAGLLFSGEASKLSGALQWGTQWTFRRMDRAMLAPIFKQISRRRPGMSRELSLALHWWQEVSAMGICGGRTHLVYFAFIFRRTQHSSAYRCGAIRRGLDSVCRHAAIYRTLNCFKRGGDGQIMSLELLSIALGACLLGN